MREDPVISRGLLKALGVLAAAAALGFGAWALIGDGVEIDLPELPDLGTTAVTTLSETALSDTTVGDQPDSPAPAIDPYTSAGFARALALLREAVGGSAELTQVVVNDVQTQFVVRRGEGVEAYLVRTDSGGISREDATVSISGTATLADFAYPLAAVRPAAIDRMLLSARRLSAASDFRPGVIGLERAIPFGSRELQWTINARGGGRNLLYRADADGRRVRNEGGAGTPVSPAAERAQRLNDCIAAAGSDSERIFRCLDQF